MLDIVNETYSDILPKTVVEHYGNERRKTKLGESVKFSLSSPVEENKNLMAIHNLHANEVLKQLDLGGMPMPSIAVTDPAKVDHEGFGDITLILDKDTIDPKKSKYNKVYSGDAYVERPAKSGALFNRTFTSFQ